MNASSVSTDVAYVSATESASTLPFIALFLLLLAWFIIGIALVLRETSVEKPNRIPQFYGYTVCLISLVIGLVSVSGLIDSAFERMNPLQSEYPFGQSLSSFAVFQATRATTALYGRESPAPPDTASEVTLRARYDALVVDRIISVRYASSKAFVTQGLFLLFAVGLFGYHWRWMRRLSVPPAAG